MMPFPLALPFVDGTRLLVARGMHGATGNWYCGLFELDEMGFVLHGLRHDELFVDAGANVGSYTVLAGGACGARVLAIEPVPAAFEALESNVRLNRLAERVTCVNVGLGAAAGTARITSALDSMNHVVESDEACDSIEIRMTTLDSLCSSVTPTIVKVDVEGYELGVAKGGRRTFSSPGVRAVIMETNGSGARYGWTDGDLAAEMRDLGFQSCTYDPIARQLEAGRAGSANTIFVRDVAEMRARVRTARRYHLINGSL
jgi:FkbM family methyltransferase